jgi:hypothetical protein
MWSGKSDEETENIRSRQRVHTEPSDLMSHRSIIMNVPGLIRL